MHLLSVPSSFFHSEANADASLLLFGLAALLAIAGVLVPSPTAAQTLLYVDADASAPGNGQSWDTAYPALQDAVDEANANPGTDYEIWVAEGTYYPDDDNVDNDPGTPADPTKSGAKDGPGDGTEHTDGTDESFVLRRDGVELYGGFSGGESSRSDRDPDANPVILSGDVDHDTGGEDDAFAPDTDSDNDATTPTQTDHLNGANASHVLVLDGSGTPNITSATVLTGITVTAGQADGAPANNNNIGGGLFCNGTGSGNECSPVMQTVTFIGNRAVERGGALYSDGASAGIANPTLTGTTLAGNAAGDAGGAMLIDGINGESSPTITDATFTNNTAPAGGAIFSNGAGGGKANFTIRNSEFRQNEANRNGGGIYTVASGTGEASPLIENVVFEQNKAAVNTTTQELGGGAIWNAANNGATASPQIIDSEFIGNEAVGDPANDISTLGGAIKSQSNGAGSTVSLTIDNTSFENNFALGAGGALFNIAFDGAQVNSSITGSTFSNNTAGSGGALLLVGFQGAAATPPKATNSIGITNTTFAGNQAVDTGLSAPDDVSNVGRPRLGGSIYVLAERGGQVDATVENVDIKGGSGPDAHTGGGVLVAADTVQSGDGSQLSLADPTFRNVTFRNLQAERGGAVTVFADEEETRPRFENVTISNATATTAGGAVEVVAKNADPGGNDARAEPTFVNTTIVGNDAARGGAIYDSTDTAARVANTILRNTILWDNNAETGDEIYNTNNGTATIDHSIVQGSGGSGGSWDGSLGTDGGSNLDQDPRFADGASLAGADGELRTADDSLALTVRSPALDVGANGAAPSTDITGANRIRDLDGDALATVNMGAYETARPGVPEPFTGPVASATGAALRGAVNPWDGANTQAQFRVYPAGRPEDDKTVKARPLSGTDLETDPADLTVSDTTARPVQGTVRRLAPDTEYEAQLIATNDEGTEASAPATFQTPPAPALQAGGGDQPLTVRLTAGSGFEADSTVFARTGGADSYTSRSGQANGSTITATVPEDFISSRRGTDYYVTFEGTGLNARYARDSGKDTLRLPAGSEQLAQRRPLNLTVGFDSLSVPSDQAQDLFQEETYRMVSIPAEADVQAALTETYGPYDPVDWRLLQWDPSGSSGQYQEFPDLEASAFAPGKAFWLTSKRGTRFGLQRGRTVDASAPLTVELEPGWNQLGNPFGVAVPWDSVTAASNVGSAVGTPLTYRDGEYKQGTTLDPWQGYFVLNTSSDPKTLRIPPVAADNQQRGTRSLRADPKSKAGSGYTLRMSAQAKDGTSTTVLGLRRGAKVGRDPLDVAQPPAAEPTVRLSAVQRAGARGAVPHVKSVKPLGGKGRTWTLHLQRPEQGPTPSTVRLDWNASGTLPDGQKQYVLDLSRGKRLSPGKTVSLESGETRRLTVIVGTERYAQRNSEETPLNSYENKLRSNYPNPFEETTTLEYTLKEKQSVKIEIYNILGQRVRTLVDGKKSAGLHHVQWDGRNRYGNRVGSGVYFSRIEAGSFTASEKMVLVR